MLRKIIQFLLGKCRRDTDSLTEEERLRIGALISWHMMPHHFIGSEKTRERYLRLWGEDFMNDVLIIEQADRGAQN